MKFIRTFRQHGIAGKIFEDIKTKTETIFLLGKERKNRRKHVQQALSFCELS